MIIHSGQIATSRCARREESLSSSSISASGSILSLTHTPNLTPPHLPNPRLRVSASASGFTLPEVTMAMGLLVLLLGGAVASHIFGALLLEKNSAKATASAEARQNITTLMSEVCSAKNVLVGNGSSSSFSGAGADLPQQGNALQIYPSSDTNVFIRYFLDTTAMALTRMTNGGAAVTLASGISNSVLFTVEDLAGNVLTNNQNNSVIGLNLQFYQVQNANLLIGPTAEYSSYQVRSKFARRAF